MYQTPKVPKINRADHIWQRQGAKKYKCLLCGAITPVPPQYPTNPEWMPERWEPLTDEERALVPYPAVATTPGGMA